MSEGATAATEPDLEIWLNAMNCVRPTDEFASDLGRQLIDELMRLRMQRPSGAPVPTLTVRLTAS